MEIKLSVKYLRLIFAMIFITAGIGHIIFHEEFTEVIPKIIPFKEAVNALVALIEIIIGITYFSKFKTYAHKLSLILLIVYVWAHIHFIQMGSCISTLCIPTWIAWARLVIIQPLLIYGVYYLLKNDRT